MKQADRVSPARQAFDRSVVGLVEGMAAFAQHHWLALANTAVLLFLGLPFLAPVLLAAEHQELAAPIYGLYAWVCHQLPFRSFFMAGPQTTYSFEQLLELVGHNSVFTFVGSSELGYKAAFCQRYAGIAASILAGGLAFALMRRRVLPIRRFTYLLLLLPIALDGFTQLFGWRESTWQLRIVTGSLFGIATVWLLYPRFEAWLGGLGTRDTRLRTRV